MEKEALQELADTPIDTEKATADVPEQKTTGRKKPERKADQGTPRYPYTNSLGALRRFLRMVPTKPRPPKIDMNLLKSWGIGDNNAYTIVRVLDAVGLTSNGTPTEQYTAFMEPSNGPAHLANLVRSTYKELFAADHAPHESEETIRRLFNIHGGTTADTTLRYMRDTFKALCEFADFESQIAQPASASIAAVQTSSGFPPPVMYDQITSPGVNFVLNVHIHLPEGRSSRDYENMIEDIGKHILKLKENNDRS